MFSYLYMYVSHWNIMSQCCSATISTVQLFLNKLAYSLPNQLRTVILYKVTKAVKFQINTLAIPMMPWIHHSHNTKILCQSTETNLIANPDYLPFKTSLGVTNYKKGSFSSLNFYPSQTDLIINFFVQSLCHVQLWCY